MNKKNMIQETRNVLYRYFRKKDLPQLSELISSSPEAMPLLFHKLDRRSQYRFLTLRYTYEKYIDRLKRFAISLSPSTLIIGDYDRTAIVAVDNVSGRVIGAVLISPLLPSWSLDIIVVDMNHRGKGIGTTLVTLAIEHMKRLGAHSIVTSASSNSVQARFFKNRGFVVRYALDEMECEF